MPLCQVVMMMLRNREQRRYQNHLYDAPSYLHLVMLKMAHQTVHSQFWNLAGLSGIPPQYGVWVLCSAALQRAAPHCE